MTAHLETEVDARAMTEFLEDSEIVMNKQKEENEKSLSFAGFAKFIDNLSHTPEEGITDQAKTAQNVSGFPQLFKSPEKKKKESGLAGISPAISENPILALLAGAVLVGGAIMLYKRFSGAQERKNEGGTERLKRKRKLKMLSEKDSKITDENFEESENEISETALSEEKEEIISGKTLGLAVAATVSGNIAGAALGDYSLVTAIPLAIIGIKKANTNLTMIAAGMAIANGYKSKSSEGNFIKKALSRVKQFFINLFDKFLFFKKEDEKVPQGYYRTLLGLIPLGT